MMFKLILKSGAYYELFKIKFVKLEGEFIEIKANQEKGKRYKLIMLRLSMITKKSYQDFIKFLKKEFKYYEYDGLCPYCNSYHITEKYKTIQQVRLNEPTAKVKDIEIDEKLGCYCLDCKKKFDYNELKYSDTIIYYR